MDIYSTNSLPEQKMASKSILELSPLDARIFLLKSESYARVDLPPYIIFNNLIDEVYKALGNYQLTDRELSKAKNFDNINYTILDNKDGKYAWRPIQLIHPILYVSLVKKITENDNWNFIVNKFKEFSSNKKMSCISLPVVSLTDQKDKAEQISQWWQDIEQVSIMMSLEFDYLLETDITDCYGSIYTHSIPWSLHGKTTAKTNKSDKNLIGNVIDNYIQWMCYGQTNGIPQGSVLMDLIAEIVLSYADQELSNLIHQEGIVDYKILRYRDDYRIFVNNLKDGDKILKLLTTTVFSLGLKLNPSKTKASNAVIRSSIKSDKLAWMMRKKYEKNLQRQLLIVHDHALQFPNTGSLITALSKYYSRFSKCLIKEQPLPLIAIVVDIALHNPRAYPICAAIISQLLFQLKTLEEKQKIITKIHHKFSHIPHTGYMEIWLQRITLKIDKTIKYKELLCQLTAGTKVTIWNTDWLPGKFKKTLDISKIINQDIIKKMESVISRKEIELFIFESENGYSRGKEFQKTELTVK